MSRVLLNHYKASAELDAADDDRISGEMAVEEELEQFGFGRPATRHIKTGSYIPLWLSIWHRCVLFPENVVFESLSCCT